MPRSRPALLIEPLSATASSNRILPGPTDWPGPRSTRSVRRAGISLGRRGSGLIGLTQLFEARQHFFRKERQIADRVLVRHETGMAHRQEIAHATARRGEIDDLII